MGGRAVSYLVYEDVCGFQVVKKSVVRIIKYGENL